MLWDAICAVRSVTLAIIWPSFWMETALVTKQIGKPSRQNKQ